MEYDINNPEHLREVLGYQKERNEAGGHFGLLAKEGLYDKKRNSLNSNRLKEVNFYCDSEKAYSRLLAKRITLAKANNQEWLSRDTLAMLEESRAKYRSIRAQFRS